MGFCLTLLLFSVESDVETIRIRLQRKGKSCRTQNTKLSKEFSADIGGIVTFLNTAISYVYTANTFVHEHLQKDLMQGCMHVMGNLYKFNSGIGFLGEGKANNSSAWKSG